MSRRNREKRKFTGLARKYIEPVVNVFADFETGVANMFGDSVELRKDYLPGMSHPHVRVGKYDIEIVYLIHRGEDAGFEFYVRHDGKIMRLIGVPSPTAKEPLPPELANRSWESLTPEEIERIKAHTANNARRAREAYLKSIGYTE